MHDRRIVNDILRRDNETCCLTGTAGTFFDPLVVVPVIPAIEEPLDKVSEYPSRAVCQCSRLDLVLTTLSSDLTPSP